MAGIWVAILVLTCSAALIFVLALLFLVDSIANERRAVLRRRARDEEVPEPQPKPKLFDQDAEEGWEG